MVSCSLKALTTLFTVASKCCHQTGTKVVLHLWNSLRPEVHYHYIKKLKNKSIKTTEQICIDVLEMFGVYLHCRCFKCSNAERTTVAADRNFGSCRIWTCDRSVTGCLFVVKKGSVALIHRKERNKIRSWTHFLTLINYKKTVRKQRLKHCFFVLHVKYTPYVQSVPGIQQSETTTLYHRSIYLSSENRIKIWFLLSYTSILHVSSLYVSALSQLTYYFFLNVPYKKGCWHAHSLPHSLSVESADSEVPEPQMDRVLWVNIIHLYMAFRF